DHLAQVVDALGGTVASAQCPQVDHRAVLPEEGVAKAVRRGSVPDDLAGLVEVVGVTPIAAERAQVRDGKQGRHAAGFQGLDAWPIRRDSKRGPSPVVLLVKPQGGAESSQPTAE